MAKPFSVLRNRMSPERRERIDARTRELLENNLYEIEIDGERYRRCSAGWVRVRVR